MGLAADGGWASRPASSHSRLRVRPYGVATSLLPLAYPFLTELAGIFLRSFRRSEDLPPCLPLLHGHYPASPLLRRLCHPPGSALGRTFSRLVIPDSRHSNFLPFYLQPPAPFPPPRSLNLRSGGCRSRFALAGRHPVLGFASSLAGSPMVQAESSSSFVYGLAVRLGLLPTPPVLGDAVTSGYGQPVRCPKGTFTLLLMCALRRTGERLRRLYLELTHRKPR